MINDYVTRVFKCNPNLDKLHESIANQKAGNVSCHTIIESFIHSTEHETTEVVQLMSVSKITLEETEPLFYKAVYDVSKSFQKVSKTVEIDSEEYYEKLLTSDVSWMIMKMRIAFDLNGFSYVYDYAPENEEFSIVEIKYRGNGEEASEFLTFKALPLKEEQKVSIEEACYNFLKNSNK